jgi:mono/diheme cytochrome c family protein
MKTILSLLLIALLIATAAFAQLKGNVENGKSLYVKNGCWQCHGYSGQGGNAGARLAQTKFVQAAFIAFVRNPPPGGMPPYRPKVMPDQELADVFAFILTFPEPAKNIPLLNP